MIQFGWAEVDITPKEKIALAGEFFERATKEVETPLTVTALAIDTGDEQTVICSCDLVSVSADLCSAVRDRIGNIGLDPKKIIICAVHIHNSYTYRRRAADTGMTSSSLGIIKQYMPPECRYIPEVTSNDCMDPGDAFEFLADSVAAAVAKAWTSRTAGGYAPGFGRAAVGMNRRVCYSDGTAKMWGDADSSTFTELEGGNDNGVELLFVYDSAGKMTGIVANIACPAQVMEQRSVISSDYWGKVKILLRQKYGDDLFLLPLCSAAGDLCPRDLIRWVEPETPIKDPNIIRPNPKLRDADPSMFDVKGTWKIGRRIVNEIELVLEDIGEIRSEAVHSHLVRPLMLPLRRVTDAECAEAEAKLKEFFAGRTRLDYNDSAALYIYAGTLKRRSEQEQVNTVSAECHVVRLGDLVFATDPFELFLNYGNQIRARSSARQTFLIQLANGCLSYLPTEVAERHGHYSAYVSSGYVGHEGGQLLVSATLDGICQLFCGERQSFVCEE